MSPPEGAVPANSNSNLRLESVKSRRGSKGGKGSGALIIAIGNYALRVLLPSSVRLSSRALLLRIMKIISDFRISLSKLDVLLVLLLLSCIVEWA